MGCIKDLYKSCTAIHFWNHPFDGYCLVYFSFSNTFVLYSEQFNLNVSRKAKRRKSLGNRIPADVATTPPPNGWILCKNCICLHHLTMPFSSSSLLSSHNSLPLKNTTLTKLELWRLHEKVIWSPNCVFLLSYTCSLTIT